MKEYELTDEQYQKLIEACQPIPLIAIHAGPIPSVQDRANYAWSQLGKELGFVWDTVKPVPGKSHRFFTAEEITDV